MAFIEIEGVSYNTTAIAAIKPIDGSNCEMRLTSGGKVRVPMSKADLLDEIEDADD